MFKKIINYVMEAWADRIANDAIEGYFDNQEVNPSLVQEIRNKISHCEIEFNDSVLGKNIFTKNTNIQLVFHQYLLSKLIGRMFNRVILSSLHLDKKIIYPLPLKWLRIIKESGLRVSYLWSTSFFYLFILICLVSGLSRFFVHLRKNHNREKINRKYVYFFNINQKCFPEPSNHRSYDIFSWYTKKYIPAEDSDKVIMHSVPNISNYNFGEHSLIYAQDCFPRISKFNFYFKFIPSVVLTILTLIILLRFKYIIILNEIIDMYVFRYSKRSDYAEKYFFSFENRIYRPLWTYLAELRGSSLFFYFYACNISNYKELNKLHLKPPEFWHVMNWPKYLVWNDHHYKYIRELIKFPSKIEVVGPIGYEDNSLELPKITKKSLILFDIQPFKLSYGIPAFCSPYWFTYDHKLRIDFYKDVHEICTECGIELFFKRKRVSDLANSEYTKFLRDFVKNTNVHELDSDISAFRLCKHFNVVLSFPFTSTAILGRYYGKESVYYDPSGKIQKDDPAAHNIDVLSKKEELRQYIKFLFKE
jgi:polysaccharide biosynthesis PFTS motif protein